MDRSRTRASCVRLCLALTEQELVLPPPPLQVPCYLLHASLSLSRPTPGRARKCSMFMSKLLSARRYPRIQVEAQYLSTPTSQQQAASRIQIEQHSYLDHPSPMGLVLRILAPANQQSHLARMRMGRTDMKAHTWGRQDKSHPAKRHTQPGANSPSSGAMSVNAVDSTLGRRFSEQDYLQGST